MEKIQIFTDLKKARFATCLDYMQRGVVDYNAVTPRGGNYFAALLEGVSSKYYTDHLRTINQEIVLNIAKRLCREKIDFNFLDKNGNNFLMLLAKQHKNYSLFPYFLDKISLEHTNNDQDNILQVICKSGNMVALNDLLKHGYPLNDEKINYCYRIKNGQVFRTVNKFNINRKSEDLLFFKDIQQHYLYLADILRFYQDSGISFFVQDRRGNTPLHYILKNGIHQLVELFPKDYNMWFTPNHEGTTCYSLLHEFVTRTKKEYSTSIYLQKYFNSLHPLYEKSQLSESIEEKSVKQQFKI